MNELHLQVIPVIPARDSGTRRNTRLVAEFPPDFVHGSVELQEIYAAFGEHWVGRAAFVQHHCAPGSAVPVAVSVAVFDDWFLRIEHRLSRDADGWLSDVIAERDLVIELHSDGHVAAGDEGARWIDLDCPSSRLQQLERRVLGLHRDGCHDWITEAETNLLSLVTLVARLGVQRIE